jgi:hypothetical protein
MCPAGYSNACTGKEGYPTLAWEATVDHHMRFMAVTKSFHGSLNDKTIVKFDKFINDLNDGSLYKDVTYNLFNVKGDLYNETGLYVLCDGYLK